MDESPNECVDGQKKLQKFKKKKKSHEWRKPILKFIWNLKGSQIAKNIEEKHKDQKFIFPDFKTCKATITETVWNPHRDRHMD